MSVNNILLSVVIPTKNRYSTLVPVLKALTKHIIDDRIEFIVQDNSDNNEDFLSLQDQMDHRIHYYYTNKDYSIKENTIASIEKASGRYLIFIGDDDLISHDIMKVVEFLDVNDINCLTYTPGYYWWDSVLFDKPTFYHKRGALWHPKINQSLTQRFSNREIEFVLNQGAAHFFNLPRFYHGIVKREVLDRIKEKTGSYLNGSSPDMAFALSIALEIDTYYHIDYPVSLYGASKNSGGGWSASNKHFGQISDQKHLPKNINELWDPFIPKIWSEKSIYAQTVVEVFKIFNVENRLNYNVLYGTMLAYEPYLLKYIKPALGSYTNYSIKNLFTIFIVFLKKKAGIYLRRLKYRTRSFGFEVEVVGNVDNVMKVLKRRNNFLLK